ncbi:MAG TPA: segregation/condensation protein A [Bacillales bacterium]|nr:segregation/condensation protein A [Bacillales bacterium]
MKLDAFEGPLDLLLHLVNRMEIDIHDISITEITDQYLRFIHAMQELQLDVAGDYLVMAATLLHVKSKMLLPNEEIDVEDDEYEAFAEDPREELIRRLVEYRKYKIVSERLRERESRWQQAYAKPPVPLGEPQAKVLGERSVYDLAAALQKMIRRKLVQVPRKTKIRRQEWSVKDRMNEIMTVFKEAPGRKSFSDFYDPDDREHLVTTFLAVLELMKKRKVACKQEGNFSEISIYELKEGDESNE